ncbi:MAG: acylphosphatase [Phycisphaerales bacterium JB039]
MAQRRRARYTGRVQGVGFRATTLSIARDYDVVGWVRNDPDGAVTLEAQGDPEEVSRFLDAVADRMGELISAVDTDTIRALGQERSFTIQR